MNQLADHPAKRQAFIREHPHALAELEEAVCVLIAAGWNQMDVDREMDIIFDKHFDHQEPA